MRVLLLNQYYAPDEVATARLLAELGEYLAERGHEVTVVCSDRDYTNSDHAYPRCELLRGVRVWRTRGRRVDRNRRGSRLVADLNYMIRASLKLLFRFRSDVVVSLSTPPMLAVPGLVLARIHGARSIYWVMDLYPEVAFVLGALERRSLMGRWLERLSNWSLRASDENVALGEGMASELRRRGARATTVIHNWEDGERIRPRAIDGHPLRSAWGWEGRFVVLYSGTLGRAHEYETCLAAARRLSDYPEILFVFAVAGARADALREEVSRQGLENVRLQRPVEPDQLSQALSSADLHLVTLRAGLGGLLVPSKLYGILAAGRPTLYIGPSDGEVATILDAGACGLSVEPGDVAGVCQAIQRFRGDPEWTTESGRSARRLFERRFGRERALAEFGRLLDPGPKRG